MKRLLSAAAAGLLALPATAEEHPPHHEPPAEPRPVDWSKLPHTVPLARTGWFTLKPTGPGFYTLRDRLHGTPSPEAPPAPFGSSGSDATPSYDRDFRYLDKPENPLPLWSDCYKRVHFGDDWLFSSGGEFRYRFNDYSNSQLSGQRDRFDPTRLRAYGDLWYREDVRLFAEYIDARSYNDSLPPATSDVTGADVLNGFVEVRAAEIEGHPVQIRGGRQEVVLGSQRLVASPDFSNTLRTYDGVRGYWNGPKWSANLFWVRPVLPNANRFDSSDDRRSLGGLFVTHKPTAHSLLDAYLLNLSDTRSAVRGDITTLGARFAGDVDKRLLCDFEGMAQTGAADGRTVSAQAATAGLGWHFARLPGNVSFWTYFDYASGTPDPAKDGTSRTFNQLFPAGHTYFGYLDLVGRQNIQDLNFQLESNPEPWLTLRAQCHVFRLSSAKDAL